MSAKLLEELTSEDFAVRLAFLSTGSALRACLQKTREVAAVRDALRQGAITEQTIRQFVSHLMKDFIIGEHYAHQYALAALCVAIERRPTAFAEKFLDDLSDLQLAEMSLCIRVARECLKHRVDIARCESRTFPLQADEAIVRFSVVSCQSSFPENGNRLENTTDTYRVA